MPKFLALLSEARSAYEAGEKVRAALTYRQAAEYALKSGNNDEWYKAMVWAVESEFHAGRYLQAQYLLLETRLRESGSFSTEHWLNRKLRFKIAERWRPRRTDLEEILADLEKGAQGYRAPPQDLATLRGKLDALKGNWQAARENFEQAFLFCRNDSGGYVRASIAVAAFHATVSLKDFTAAENWVEAIRAQSKDEEGWNAANYAEQAWCRLVLSQARREPLLKLKRLVREFDEKAVGLDSNRLVMAVRLGRGRVALLDPEAGDPGKSLHAGRHSCVKRLISPLDAIDRYEYSLLILDTRLAAVRYAAGLSPVDDEFDELVPPFYFQTLRLGSGEVMDRLHKARLACHVAHGHALHLDTMLESDWRQKQVQRRSELIANLERNFRLSTAA